MFYYRHNRLVSRDILLRDAL